MTHGLRYATALVIPFIAALVLTPLAGVYARRLGLLAQPRGDRFHLRATPYFGGLAIGAGLLAVGFVSSSASGELLVILVGALGMLTLGLIDDLKGIGPLAKICVEATAAVALWAAGVRIGITGVAAIDLVLTVTWVVAVTNALNLLDNADGIAAGVTAVAALGIGAIAAAEGQYLVASLAFAVAGGAAGFLVYNAPPARIFMGDAGALMLGFLLAALALKLEVNDKGAAARSAVAVLAVGVPLFDMVLVVLHRLRNRRPIHRGGTDHTAHRLHAKGTSPRRILWALMGAQAVSSAGALIVASSSVIPAVALLAACAAAAAATMAIVLRMPIHTPEMAGTDAVAG